MENLIVRCSSLSKIMTKPRSKSEEISATTKSYLKELAKEQFYGYQKQLDTPAIKKGLMMEQESINLLNSVTFSSHKKNTERKCSTWLTGEADIVTKDTIIDIKSSWSLETFPAFQEDAKEAIKKAGYEWQLRGYMMLWEKPKAQITYCMVSTPETFLNDWDNWKIHEVDHLEGGSRITTVEIERDEEKEKEIIARYEIANKYYQKYINELKNK
jgi:hypothetical protein